ncbi:MAG: hypothetical protein Q8R82_00780 [Hyphomonadaceae bacterium]|nr:hypothetical protein [Hyphomonadaceae bacterium]
MKIPKLLVSTVVRGAQRGESHGALYLVDIAARDVEQVADWRSEAIDFSGQGGDRGLRGIAVVGKEIFVAASDEIFAFDPWFQVIGSWKNPYLKHCHEISAHGGKLYLTSTAFDAVLRMDVKSRRFERGMKIVNTGGVIGLKAFDPGIPGEVERDNLYHLNSVHADASSIFVAGRKMPALVKMTEASIEVAAGLPRGAHNARPFEGGILYNDGDGDAVVWATQEQWVASPVPRYPREALVNAGADTGHGARQVFGRGLCVLSEKLVAAGSSPATVSVHDVEAGRVVEQLNLTMDVRQAVHGLAAWPF